MIFTPRLRLVIILIALFIISLSYIANLVTYIMTTPCPYEDLQTSDCYCTRFEGTMCVEGTLINLEIAQSLQRFTMLITAVAVIGAAILIVDQRMMNKKRRRRERLGIPPR
jgi:hypothetical protein